MRLNESEGDRNTAWERLRKYVNENDKMKVRE